MNKLFLLAIAYCFSSIAYTQTDANTETINEELFDVERKFGQLNQTEITSDNLINRSFLFMDHANFYATSTDTNTYGGWQQLYHEIYNGYFNGAVYPNLDTIKNNSKQQQQNGIVPLLILDLEYEQIKENAIADSLLIIENGIFKDVFPRTQSPYETKRIVSFAPATNEIYKNNYTFLVSKHFFFTNQSVDPTSIVIDFGDGNGYQTVNWETTYQITYTDVTEKILSIKLNYGSNDIITQSVLKPLIPCIDCLTFLSDPNNLPSEIGSITASIPVWGDFGVIDYYIKSSSLPNTPSFLDKPFIIVEGLDFETEECVGLPLRNGSIGWCSLWGQGGEPAFDKAPDLLNTLLAQGYDIIMIDHKNGSTYIEQNAFALIDFIKYLNNRGAGPNVIVGTSMGGLVSRYALAQMEKDGEKHCNRLWVSVDAPQQGANIPIGMQAMLQYFSGNGPGFITGPMQDNYDNIREPAPKQLLTNHIDAVNGNETAERQHFKNSIATLGYPQKTRKIAVSNGSRTGAALAMQPGEKVFEWTIPAQFLGCGQLGNKAEIWAKHHNGSGRVFKGKIIDGLAVNLCALTAALCPTCVNQFSSSYSYFFNGQPSYDRMPGGRRNSYQDIKDNVQFFGLNAFIGTVSYPDHCFIPTKSGLDLNSSVGYFDDLTFPTNIIDRPSPSQSLAVSPFEKLWAADESSLIQGSSQNELHVELTPNNINWLINEICAGENLIGNLLSTTYNYARPENRFLNTLTIANGGNLLVNANQLSDFGFISPQPCTGPKMPLAVATYILESSDCMEFLEIKNGGKMQIGDNTAGNAAKVIIHKGVVVTLRTGSKLLIHDNSTLIIEDGAKLVVEAGVDIQLLGDEAVLELQGELILGNNATFTFTHPNSSSGYLKFNVPFNPCSSNPNWACSVITAGYNASIDLRGDNKTDKILEITDGDMLMPTNLELFRLSFGKAVFVTADSRLSLGGKKYILSDATFEGQLNGRGITVYGNPSSIIVRSDFDKVIVRGELYYGVNRLIAFQSNFTNGAFVETRGKVVFFTEVNFENLTSSYLDPQNSFTGWSGLASDLPSVYDRGNIQVSAQGFSANGKPQTGGVLNDYSFSTTTLSKVDILRGHVSETMGVLRMRCSSIIGSPIATPNRGLFFSDNAQLRMSNIDGFGYNIINQNPSNVSGSDIGLLDFEYGFNNFVQGEIRVNYGLSSANIPTTIGGNTNVFFGNNPATSDPNITPDNTYNFPWNTGPKVIIQGTPPCFPNNPPCNVIPVAWQFVPNPTPPSPCSGGPGGGGGNPTTSPLKNCVTCPLVSSANFNNVPLNEAILFASAKMELTDTTQNDITAIELFYEIFSTTTIDITNPDQAFLARYALANMKNALQNCFVTGRIDEAGNTPVLHTCTQHFLAVLDSLKETITTQNYNEQFYLELDAALTYRLIGQRDEALLKLQTIDNCYLTERHRQLLKQLTTITKIEADVINGIVPKEEAYKLFDAVPKTQIPNTINTIDPSANVHPSIQIGTGVSIGANVIIEKDVIIGNNVTIENDVVINKNVTIGNDVLIKKRTVIEKGVTIEFNVEIGKDAVVGKNSYIANNTNLANNVKVKDNVHINSFVEVKRDAVIKDKVNIGSGVFIGNNAVINEKSELGELSVLRKNVVLKDKVIIGNANIIAKDVVLKDKVETGSNVKIKQNIVVPNNKTICDNDTVNANYNYNNSCTITAPDLLENTNTCNFAMSYAKTRTNYLNGFTILNTTKVIVGDEVTFKPNQLASFYNWSFGDCGSSTTESPTYIFQKVGIYLITLNIGTSCNSSTYYGAISVYPNPSSDITPTIPFCANNNDVTLNRLTTIDLAQPLCYTTTGCPTFIPLNPSNCQLHLLWNFGNDSTQEEFIEFHQANLTGGQMSQSFTQNGLFNTTLTTTLAVREETAYDWVDSLVVNTTETDVSISSCILPVIFMEGCAVGNVQFYNNLSGGVAPYTYSWIFGNGATSTLSSPLISLIDTGELTIQLTITDVNGCSKILNSTVNIADCNASARQNINDENEQAESSIIKNELTQLVNVYPNPTKGQLTFEYQLTEKPAQLIITDVLGKTILSHQIGGDNKITIDLSPYNKGIFLYRIISNQKLIQSDKIILMD
jgi:UDP-3-O-[3-hydroxymyristoyl] glucosamine N-acyltransferase